MFIEFNVTNFRSIKETLTLSMAASKYYRGLEETNCLESGITGLPKLLRSGVIYGPNAGGKSNLFKAMQFMQAFVLTSHALQEGKMISVAPFALTAETREDPCEFEIFFIQDQVRYQYGLALNTARVVKEWLLAYPEGKAQRWFERSYDKKTDKENWYFGSKFTGRKQLWQEATRKNALFLSTAIQLNNEQLKPIFNWFQQKLSVVLPGETINLQFTIDKCGSDEGRNRIMEFMNSADISIYGIDIELKKIPIPSGILPEGIPQEVKEKIVRDLQEKGVPLVRFQHRDNNNQPVFFHISEESDGTQKLFAFSGPWLDVLERGRILFVDELDTSLHPLLIRFLVENFHSKKANKNNAQLVFSTHDTSILDTDLFRRDQIWFVEKDHENATKLTSLSDFSPRKGEAIEKGYLKGRYGALPAIKDLKI
ncbi:MAG: ATP-binding protein [Deltaproteobacteria bacterium]|nr:ATP-binding protein [Deltaproteobacteria bacterium]